MTKIAAHDRKAAIFDLTIVMGVLVAIKQSVLPYSVVYAGPASTFSAMIVATFVLHRRGVSWADLGFRWPESWPKTLGWTVLIFAGFVATANGASALADVFFEDIGASGRFDFVRGNLVAYGLVMLLVWTHGSFFEELLFRAFIISKSETVFGGRTVATVGAVLFAAVFFGYRHYYYQGAHGALVTGAIGLAFGIVYVTLGRRNLLPLILVHGLANSISQTSRYLG